ncbi:MAG TPA: DUF2059 domain-containing protein [Allosphingosinicella sp.]|jgi:hypothetical protein|nr:DUF2059 domain-containing protein [Allosphingosinicella sp.]
MRHAIFLGFALGLAPPALAAQAPATQPPPASAPAPEAPDAARLVAAGRLVDLMMPPGSMRDVMSDFMPDLDMILAQTAESLGIDTEGMSTAERARAVEARGVQRDRHFRERMRITLEVSRRVMSDVMAEMEPDMRRIMVTMMARHFDQAELGELLTFITTPTGRKYAQMSLNMGRDPAWQEMMTLMLPRITAATARVADEVRAATAHLDPPPRI